jgi:hypothetical protein
MIVAAMEGERNGSSRAWSPCPRWNARPARSFYHEVLSPGTPLEAAAVSSLLLFAEPGPGRYDRGAGRLLGWAVPRDRRGQLHRHDLCPPERRRNQRWRQAVPVPVSIQEVERLVHLYRLEGCCKTDASLQRDCDRPGTRHPVLLQCSAQE